MTNINDLSPLFVALDSSDLGEVLRRASLVMEVEGNFGFKVNDDVLFANDPTDVIRRVGDLGHPVFADLKMYKGARTMIEQIQIVARAGAVMTNIFVGNALALLEKTARAAEDEGISLFGIGVLTHMTEEDCQALYGCSLAEVTMRLGQWTAKAGLHGYICPGNMNREGAVSRLPLLNPAVRPASFVDTKTNDQEQTVTPTVAFATGASIVVCGSPIFKSPDPVEAIAQILEEIRLAA